MTAARNSRKQLTDAERLAVEFEITEMVSHSSGMGVAKALNISQSAVTLAQSGRAGSYVARQLTSKLNTDITKLVEKHSASIQRRTSIPPASGPRHRALNGDEPMNTVSPLILELSQQCGWLNATAIQLELYRRATEDHIGIMDLVRLGELYNRVNIEFATTISHKVQLQK